MPAKRVLLISALVLVIILAGGCNAPEPDSQQGGSGPVLVATESPAPEVSPTEEAQPTGSGEDPAPAGDTTKVVFEQLGISLEVPNQLYVQKNPLVSYDDPGRLESYLFYIQNYGQPGGSPSGSFQIYGHLQYNLEPISWDVFAENTLSSSMNAYATEIEVNGLRGFDTQLSGERNRYVYQFLLNGQVLSLAVADPTQENKALADQIISTLQFDPASFTQASGIQLIGEPESYYRIYIPADWSYSFGPTGGVRISDLQAESADAELVVEETDGPHTNIQYKSGIFMNLVILEDDSAMTEPAMAEVTRSTPVMFAGIEMTDYVFREPSTAEGEIRELRFLHNGLSYLLRFSYAADADQYLIDWIILHLEIAP
jgi:hypothetical protein